MNTEAKYSGNIVDVVNSRTFKGSIFVSNGIISKVVEEDTNEDQYIIPGLIDAHIHIESSMLIPSEFARLAVVHGTVSTVSDPHEIANVMGIDGVRFMINNGKKVPFKFFFGAPSCVPATGFETAGAIFGISETEELLKMDEVLYLSEMMNYPGVLFKDEEVMAKLNLAKKFNKPVDGHAPGLKGEDARTYIESGISTDHECFTIDEAKEKIKYGMKVLIREGSAAKDFDALVDLLHDNADDIMFCSDDKHPNDLTKGHINELIKKAIALGHDPIKVLRSCIYNPIKHYNLDVGMLRKGDAADFNICDNLEDFNILKTYINGEKVAENGQSLLNPVLETPINQFNINPISISDIELKAESENIKVIEAIDGLLITKSTEAATKIDNGFAISDTDNDILKIVVINRYKPAAPAIAFIKGFGLKKGAIASTVAHDSHNIVAVGTKDKDLVSAINLLIESKGGIAVSEATGDYVLPLAVAGIMSNKDGNQIAKDYELIDAKAKELGSTLKAPFMTLSFMALLVIPELKLGDKGLFDGSTFSYSNVFIN